MMTIRGGSRLKITIFEAKDLRNMDGLLGKNDPYCLIKVGGISRKTKIIQDSGSAANWSENFTFICELDDTILIEVFDYDHKPDEPDDFLGKLEVSVFELSFKDDAVMEGWFGLSDIDSEKGGDKAVKIGEIRVRMEYISNDG